MGQRRDQAREIMLDPCNTVVCNLKRRWSYSITFRAIICEIEIFLSMQDEVKKLHVLDQQSKLNWDVSLIYLRIQWIAAPMIQLSEYKALLEKPKYSPHSSALYTIL